MPKTRVERIVKSVQFFLHKIKVPQNTPKEEILEVTLKLSKALEHNVPPVLQDTNDTAVALQNLAIIFLNSTIIPHSNPYRHTSAPRVKQSKAESSPRVIKYKTAASPMVLPHTSLVAIRSTLESAHENSSTMKLD